MQILSAHHVHSSADKRLDCGKKVYAVYFCVKEYLQVFEIVYVFPEIKLTQYVIHATVLDNVNCFHSNDIR